MHANTAVRAFLLTALVLSAAAPGQGQGFNAGQWFFGKNATSDLPTGVVDLSDHLFASETYTCALVMTGAKSSPQTQIACRQHLAGSKFVPVIQEGDPRLGATRLAIPVRATDDTGRYLTSMVRPEKTHLYFTSVVNNSTLGFSHQIAWRLRNYTTLERVAGAGDVVTVKLENGTTQPVTLTSAGPVDANAEGREFIYLETGSPGSPALFGIFEIQTNGVFNLLFKGRIPFKDTPWGMGGFAFADGGIAFKQAPSLYVLDPNNRCGPAGVEPCLTTISQQGTSFIGDSTRIPNLNLAQMFRPTDDPHTFYFSWGIGNGMANPNEIVSVWKSYAWGSVFDNNRGTPQEVSVGSFASGSQTTLMGTGTFGSGTDDFDPRITVKWPISSLWIKTPTGFTRMLRDSQAPDIGTGAKKFYQGITSYACEAEFATKQNDGSFDNSGSFSNFYRLYRPCPSTASFNSSSGEIVIRGINLADQSTQVVIPPPPGSLAPTVNATVTSATATEVRATAPAGLNVQRVSVVVNNQVISDPIGVNLSTSPPPNIANLTDINGDLTVPAQGKHVRLTGQFGCQTAQTQTVNYPTSMGNCNVTFDNGTPAPLLYTSDTQINLLLPADLPTGPRGVRVTRTDALGVFTSNPFPFNLSIDVPVAIKTVDRSYVIVVVIRNGQVVVIGPNDPIHPGEYFTIYLTGGLIQTLPPVANVGGLDTPYAAAVVNWAQGVTQVNIVTPNSPGVAIVKLGQVPTFNVRIN